MKTIFEAERTINFCLFLSSICVGIWSQQYDSYQAVKQPNGTALCATQAPAATNWLPTKSAAMRCGVLCQSISVGKCYGYNVRKSTGQCDLYDYVPRNFSVVDGCVFFTLTFKEPCRIIVEAYGFPPNCSDAAYPNTAYVTVNGQTVFKDYLCDPNHAPTYRGINLFLVNTYTCTATLVNHFDIYAATVYSDEMATYIASLHVESVLIGVTCDDAVTCMTSNGYDALAGLGVNVSSVQQHGCFAFIAQVGYITKTVASIVPQPYTTQRAKFDVLLSGWTTVITFFSQFLPPKDDR